MVDSKKELLLKRESPVSFESRPQKTEMRDYYVVVLEYENEGQGPWIVDLSHKTRWDLQDSRLDNRTIYGAAPPSVPGECRIENGMLLCRMNQTQTAVWHLGNEAAPKPPVETGYTDVSEADVFLALFGPNVFAIVEKLSALDLTSPKGHTPCLFQGPFSRIPTRIVVLTNERNRAGAGALLIACSRGYATDMVHAVLSAGEEFGLRPAGENVFTHYLETIEMNAEPRQAGKRTTSKGE